MELPKKWFVEVTKENQDVLNKWRLSQPGVVTRYDFRFREGCLIISDGYCDKSYFYMSGRESYLMDNPHEEISYEDFVKYVLPIDYTIPGTRLPEMPRETLKRCVNWENSSEDEPFSSIKKDYISFGSKMFNGHLYILNESSEYLGSNYFMVKLSDIERLAKEQNFNQKQKENMKQITSEQAQQIIDIACSTWKDRLATKWGRKIVFKETIEISDNDYQEMRKACTAPQNELFDEIFGKDTPKVKVGDWIVPLTSKLPHQGHGRANKAYEVYEIIASTVCCYNEKGKIDGNGKMGYNDFRLATEEEITKAKFIPEGVACLVRDYKSTTWKLVYSDGKGRFNSPGKDNYDWEYVQILDVNNLPKY